MKRRESERKQILELLQSLKISSDSVLKMVDELASLLDMFRSFKKAGRSAALTMSTKGGTATKVKLEVELDDAEPPSPISTSTPSTSPASAPSLPACQAAGDRLRPRGSSARRAKAKARAARHQAFLCLCFAFSLAEVQCSGYTSSTGYVATIDLVFRCDHDCQYFSILHVHFEISCHRPT